MMKYLFLPFFAWFFAGSVKFIINYIRFGKDALKHIGYGGFPSTHTSLLSSVVFLVGFEHGFRSSIFSFALGTLMILIIDAHGLRRKVGEQAAIINRLQEKVLGQNNVQIREKMGHSWLEIAGGLCIGLLLAFFFNGV